MTEAKFPRREFLKSAGAGGAAALAAGLAPSSPAEAQALTPAQSAAASQAEAWLTLNPTEAAFIVAAVDTLIPADDLTPSGSDCGVAVFIDRQLAGAFGNGARLYRSGPYFPAKAEHGYQLPLSPREFFRAGIEETNAWTRKFYGKDFDHLAVPQREEALKALESDKADFNGGFSSAFFFDALLTLAMEGFFADPIYGGNRDKIAWKMIGFPGLPASYREEIKTYFGKKYDKAPQSIADFS